MNTQPKQLFTRTAARAFTMIELLVVFAIIAILAGLILAGAGHAMTKARISRAESERDALVSAIEDYKRKRGSYPPDNPLSATQTPLFYELTGMTITTDASNAPAQYTSAVSGDVFVVGNNDFTNVFGPIITNTSVIGFQNASTDPAQINNFLGAASKSGITGKMLSPTGSVTNTFLGVPVPGPLATTTADGKVLVPWSYVSKNPTNNPDAYDLWLDVSAGGKLYRVSNWSKEPKPL